MNNKGIIFGSKKGQRTHGFFGSIHSPNMITFFMGLRRFLPPINLQFGVFKRQIPAWLEKPSQVKITKLKKYQKWL